jgi:hypothetical protein
MCIKIQNTSKNHLNLQYETNVGYFLFRKTKTRYFICLEDQQKMTNPGILVHLLNQFNLNKYSSFYPNFVLFYGYV